MNDDEFEVALDDNNYQPDGSYELVPNGQYTAIIERAELHDTKTSGGKRLSLMWSITGPTHEGRKIFSSINTKNSSTKAEEIGRRELNRIRLALGITTLRRPSELVGKPCLVQVKTRPASNGYEADNVVRGYKALSSGIGESLDSPPARDASKPPWAQ